MDSPLELKIRAEAKASLSAVVPSESIGRLVDAITDIVRPFSEARGLRADQIRLQREDVAWEITKRCKERLALERVEVRPLDLKVLIPLLEKGSCEDPSDSDMIDRWAELLAATSRGHKVQPRFVQLLGELNSSQAALLAKIAFNEDPMRESVAILPTSKERARQQLTVRLSLVERTWRHGFLPGSVVGAVRQALDHKGNRIEKIGFFRKKHPCHGGKKWIESEGFSRDTDQIDLEILRSLGLIEPVSLDVAMGDCSFVSVRYSFITELGGCFLATVDPGVAASWPKFKTRLSSGTRQLGAQSS